MRVAVLGAGYAGVTVARRLEDRLPAGVELVVVDESGRHLVQHELHRVIRRPAVADALEVPLTDVLDRAEVVTSRVTDLDPEDGRVALADGESLHYDYGALCLGAEAAFYGLPGVEEHATPLKRLPHAERIREEFLAVCETGGRAVVGGAGLSGVQVAGELAALARERGAEDRVEVRLLEREATVAPTFPSNFQRAVRSELAARDVAVETNATVTRATDERIELADGDGRGDDGDYDDGGQRAVEYDQFVWTGGIRGADAVGGDRPVVRADLRLTDRTLAVGDAARIVDADGEAVPASASAAIREARTAATNLVRLVEADPADGGSRPRLDRYRFSVPGWLVSVGDGAVAQLGPTVLTGSAARAMKATVGAGHLTSIGAIRRASELAESELS